MPVFSPGRPRVCPEDSRWLQGPIRVADSPSAYAPLRSTVPDAPDMALLTPEQRCEAVKVRRAPVSSEAVIQESRQTRVNPKIFILSPTDPYIELRNSSLPARLTPQSHNYPVPKGENVMRLSTRILSCQKMQHLRVLCSASPVFCTQVLQFLSR